MGLNLLRETGAIDDVKSTIARISDDRRVQLIVIGMPRRTGGASWEGNVLFVISCGGQEKKPLDAP